MILILHYIISSFALTFVWANCPDNSWEEWKGHCYRLSSSPLSWHDVRDECNSRFGADLASITSKAEQNFVWKIISHQQTIWLGMRAHDQSRWWLDNSRVSFTNFEPAGFSDAVKLMGNTGKWRMASAYSNTKLRGVCKMRSCRCPSGWRKWNSSCYRAKKRKISWLQAQWQCQRMAPMASLATINNARENKFVTKLSHTKRSSSWIGLNDREHESEYYWIAAPKTTTSYRNWRQRSEPNGRRHGEDCATMIHNGDWSDASCSMYFNRDGFICEQPMCGAHEEARRKSANVCPDGWGRSGNKCFSKPTTPDTFSRVQWRCSRQHPEAVVAAVSSLEDNDRAFLSAKKLSEDNDMANYGSSRLPVWIAQGGSFVNWQDNSAAKTRCVSMQVQSSSGKWLSESCEEVRPGICQVPACTPRCPADWDLFEGHCYYVNNNRKNYADAEAVCKKDGGHLTSILSQEENDYITRKAFSVRRSPKVVFIGGIRNGKRSEWSWSDCSKWNMSRWDGKDGNDPSFTNGIRAVLRPDGRWLSRHPRKRYGSVCKLDPCRKQFGPLNRLGCEGELTPPLRLPLPPPPPVPTTPSPPTHPLQEPFPPETSEQVQHKPMGCPKSRMWSDANGICVTLIFGPSNFKKAVRECKRKTVADFKVTLPVIRSPSKKSGLMKMAGGRDVWIGLSKGGMPDNWYWHDKTRLPWTNWQVRPDRRTRCASIDGKTGGLVARSCADKLPFFCEARPSESTWRTHTRTWTGVRLSNIPWDMNKLANRLNNHVYWQSPSIELPGETSEWSHAWNHLN